LNRLLLISATLCLLGMAPSVQAQRGQRAAATADEKPEDGFPVTDPLVISKCGGCHAKDDKGNLSRISWERTTPEGWEEAIKRMVRLNGLTITPAEARSIVKYLATWHGLAPEEAKPVMYMPEHRLIDETIIPNDTVRGACASCHALGRPMSWRRSKEDWKLLENMHVALYNTADMAFRRPMGHGPGAPEPAAAPGAAPAAEPGEVALEYLAKNAPLHTPEWAAWESRIRAPRLTGRWVVSANMLGHGQFVGELTIEPGPADDEFKTSVTLKSLKDGSTITRTGTSLVYAGYSWRGRSKGTTAAGKSPDDISSEARETLWISPDQNTAEGRWYWGEYQEFGFDVKLTRASLDPTLAAFGTTALKAGSKNLKVKIYGDSFPKTITPAELDLGAGVKVNSIVSHTKTEMVVDVDVAPDAVSGKRDAGLGRSILQNAFAVYHHIDYIKVIPETSLARLGSTVHPKGYQQFDAIGYENGPDGKPHTLDDVELGPVDCNWSVEEFMAVYGDDDKNFVGHLSETAFFTPASDGPNPERKFSRNNYGDVWVVAEAKNEKDKEGKPLTGRSYLVVSVPTYIKWDQPEVSK